MIRYSLALISTFFLIGCGKGFQVDDSIGSQMSFFKESSSKSFVPENDQVQSQCAQTGEICLFLKNPVFQEKKLISPLQTNQLQQAQVFSAHLTGVERGSVLKNPQFDILSVKNERLSIQDILSSRALDPQFRITSYVSAYYWLNRAHEYLKKNFNSYPSMNSSIKVYIDDGFDGWSWKNKSLHLNSQKKSALSADVLLVLLGEAQAGFATKGAIYQADSNQHRECSGDPIGCCQSASGCSQALVHGAGDIFLSLLFQDALGVGEFHHQNLNGQDICGKSRSPENFMNLSFQQAYDLCPSKKGSTLALGLVYASIFESVKKKTSSKRVTAVFLKTLSQWNGQDTFSSALQKIQQSCLDLNDPELSALFAEEFQSRN